MKYLKICFIFFSILLITSCKKDRESIYQDYKGSVVLIQTKFVYEIEYKGKKFYFKNPLMIALGGIESLSEDIKEFEDDPLIGYGTGFFISEDGKLITNRHVVDPLDKNTKEEIAKELKKLQSSELSELEDERNELQTEINEDNTELSRYAAYYSRNYYEKEDIVSRIQLNQSKIEEINRQISNKKEDSQEEIKFSVKQLSIGYALNDSHVDSDKDYKDLSLLKVSDNDDVDLALLQTKDHILPSRVENPIPICDTEENDYIKENEKVFMIGYNYGEEIANSSLGINVQINEGQISQKPADHKVLYSIPSLEGSSGSPVFNEYGEVIAVNFAGIKNNQGFNYGILAKDLNEFID